MTDFLMVWYYLEKPKLKEVDLFCKTDSGSASIIGLKQCPTFEQLNYFLKLTWDCVDSCLNK